MLQHTFERIVEQWGRASFNYKPDHLLHEIKPFEYNGLVVVAAKYNLGRRRLYFPTPCEHCGGWYLASRVDSIYCSGFCSRSANRRQRKEFIRNLDSISQDY